MLDKEKALNNCLSIAKSYKGKTMKQIAFFRSSLRLLFTACGIGLFLLPGRSELATGERGIVTTVNAAATEAGLRAFRQGGNAVDAAVACALALGVV